MAHFIDGIPYEKTEYQNIRNVIKNRPVDTFETVYRFNHNTKVYEGFERTEEEKADWFVNVVSAEEITIDDVPEAYQAAVKERLTPTEEPTTEQAVIDSIMQEVASYGY